MKIPTVVEEWMVSFLDTIKDATKGASERRMLFTSAIHDAEMRAEQYGQILDAMEKPDPEEDEMGWEVYHAVNVTFGHARAAFMMYQLLYAMWEEQEAKEVEKLGSLFGPLFDGEDERDVSQN